ncbi:hypothetical protein GX656_03425 [Candidatus Dojkabacteria bacterium]|uniref:Uncharacterized protein n=1 Tax=Candidatus Dojkabacteria bacterium TaxID=2099670 RepID=A0A847CZR9_9BACT|nr:hypothetical protein [Candidatus Dojkabacteria bacterium]
MFNLGNTQIKIPCPECQYENEVSLEDIAKQRTIICGGCLKEIRLVDNNSSTNQAIKETRRSVQNLKDTIKKISK